MPAPRMAKGGGSPSYRCSRCSLKISKAAMSTPAKGMIPSYRYAEAAVLRIEKLLKKHNFDAGVR